MLSTSRRVRADSGHRNKEAHGRRQGTGSEARRIKTKVKGGWSMVLGIMLTTVSLVGGGMNAAANGATYYLSPTGSDANLGTSASPWRTFAFAMPQLQPGDTLVLKDGTYNPTNSGLPVINCGSNAVNGTAAQPITLKAEHERQAWLQGDGSTIVLEITQCAYWTFEGLYVRSADLPPEHDYNNIRVSNAEHLIFRRMLLSHNNRYHNASIFLVQFSTNILIEESESYSYHRNGFAIHNSSYVTLRRNYANSRGYADLPDGRYSDPPNKGDTGFVIYPGTNVLLENNISEGQGSGFDIEGAYGPTSNNRYYGNISLHDDYGWFAVSREPGSERMTQDTSIENQLIVGPAVVGLYARATKNTRCTNCTLIGTTTTSGFAADKPAASEGGGGCAGDCAPSAYATSTLVLNFTSSYGFYFESQADWQIDYSNAFNNSLNFSPSGSHVTNSRSSDPHLGACLVYIPAGSPMKGAGKEGADIGANILYRYENGVLSNQPLWHPATGQFPCGAKVAGVNDRAGASCFDVHTRLNVNTNGCSLPADYKPSPPPPPANLRIVEKL